MRAFAASTDSAARARAAATFSPACPAVALSSSSASVTTSRRSSINLSAETALLFITVSWIDSMHFCPIRFYRIRLRTDAAAETPYGSTASLQRIAEQCQRLAPVTHEILSGRRKFRSSLPKFRIQEQRVVAQTTGPTRRAHNLALPQPLRNQRLRIPRVTHHHDYAVIVRLAIRPLGKRFEQFCVVTLVRLGFTGISRGVHARGPAQRIDTDAGIVRQRRQSGDARRMSRLRQRILNEGPMRLVRFRHTEC